MSRFSDLFAPKPVPKPISATRWVPLAEKHELYIDFSNKCVGVNGITEFWGAPCFDPDVGACVIKVVEMINSRDRAATLEKQEKNHDSH